jgi:Zn-dependent protease with chaperone function
LEAGLAALKEGNYYAAITKLLPIANTPEDRDTRLQALVGLVMSYAHTGEISKAIALCRNLIESDNSQVQEWGKMALEHLIKRQKRLKSKSHQQSQNIVNSNQIIKAESNTSKTTSKNYTNNIYSTTKTTSIYWRQARRAKVWQPLRKYNLIPSRLLALATFMAVFWVLRAMIELIMIVTNKILDKLPYVSPLRFLDSDLTTLLVLVPLLVLFVLSPWLLDWLLKKCYQQQPLSKEILYSYSREAVRITQRTSQQKGWPITKFQILPIGSPMMFTYGNLPRNARIVVSQGLLEKLTDDEIATIYALGLGQINRWDFGVMSLGLLVTLPIYQVYHQASNWANNSKYKICSWANTCLASLSYGIWCLLTATTLLNGRFRLYGSDRKAAEITGNPNGLIRALLKITIGIADDIKKQEHSNWQLESLNILAPVDFKHSLCLGSLAEHIPWESLLIWENSNPYRQWFTINNSHPLLGDRLQCLCKIARHWHLETELHFIYPELLQIKPQSFLLQIAPWLGIPLGCVLAGLFWLAWQIAYSLGLFNLKWIYDDWSFLPGFLMIGFSIGTVMRLNAFFPEIKSLRLDSDEQILQLLKNPSVLPLNSISVRIAGKLLGRRGTGNCLAQDLILESSIGLVKLHHIPWLELKARPQEWIGEQIIVTGWLRRGATPWIDIQSLETENGIIINSPHPIFSTILAVIAQAWGAYIMLTAQLVGS